jgi:hypothetical protein
MPASATSVPATLSTFPWWWSPCTRAASTPLSTWPATAWNWRTSLVPGGQMGSAPGGPGDQLGRAVRATPIMAMPSTQTLGRLAADVVDGQLTVQVQRTYALADVPRALADFAAGTRGKLAISVS